MEKSADDIWSGDLFGRRDEGALLIGYIESIADRPSLREDSQSYVIAVDGQYGIGKSYFLRRVARQLSQDHPVAFVDAWADDLSDEPLTALAATLKKALEPIRGDPAIGNRWKAFAQKSGKVALIAGGGVLTQAAKLAFGAGAVTAAESVWNEVGDEFVDEIRNAAKDLIGDVADKGMKVAGDRSSQVMEERIARFESGQAAIASMKASLADIIAALEQSSLSAPIVIVIDELDRCRPTYAVKLFEEIKHLFDVRGLVFILGMHGDQLAHSVAGAYGPGFDGGSYLRRFVSRRMALTEPDLYPLIVVLSRRVQLDRARAFFPDVSPSHSLQKYSGQPQPILIAAYMKAYDLPPRAAYEVMDMLQTCLALTEPHRLHLAYLLPLILSHAKGAGPGLLLEGKFQFAFLGGPELDREVSPNALARQFHELAAMDRESLIRKSHSTSAKEYPLYAAGEAEAEENFSQPASTRALVSNYAKLVTAVGRFKDPEAQSP